MSYLPLFFDTAGTKFVIIGSGQIALAKAETILDFIQSQSDSSLSVISPDKISETAQKIQQIGVNFINKPYEEAQIKDFDVIIAATDDKVLNEKIAADAKKHGKLVNAVDNPAHSDFIFGAYVKQGNITIASSTSGSSPVLARFLKERISKAIPQNLDLFGEFAEKNRDLIKEKFPDIQARRLFWSEIIEGNIGSEIFAGNVEKAQKLFEEKIQNSANKKTAAVYFIGAGCGDPELITLKAIKLLSQADVVLYDRLVAKEILAYARKDALKINVGKTKDFHKFTQDQINEMIADYAKKGNIVTRLKGGDATIFAHLGEEIAAISDLKIPYQIVPGITAASGASAYSGIPLTSREYGKAVRFLAVYKDDMLNDEYWRDLAKTDDTLVFYMSSHNLGLASEKLMQFGKDKTTPLLVVEQATTPFQKSYFSTIGSFSGEFGNKKFISPSLAIIGKIADKKFQCEWLEEGAEGEFFEKLK